MSSPRQPRPIYLVTGGSRGIGRAVVDALLAGDAGGEAGGEDCGEEAGGEVRVAFTYRSDEAAAREVEVGSGGRARAFQLDLADPERPEDLARQVEDEMGEIVGLVNNAGLRREAILAMTSDEDWRAVVDANLGGAFRCCRAVLRWMVSRRRGAIVNVSSLAALHGVSGQASYAAAKAGVLAMTRVLAREVGGRGVRVNSVVPGFVATDMTADLPQHRVEALTAGQCLKRGVAAADVADAVTFLLSPRAAAITGQALVVDAGTSA